MNWSENNKKHLHNYNVRNIRKKIDKNVNLLKYSSNSFTKQLIPNLEQPYLVAIENECNYCEKEKQPWGSSWLVET